MRSFEILEYLFTLLPPSFKCLQSNTKNRALGIPGLKGKTLFLKISKKGFENYSLVLGVEHFDNSTKRNQSHSCTILNIQMSKQLKARILLPSLLPASNPSNDRLTGKCSLNYRTGTAQVRNRIGYGRFKRQSSNMIVENKGLTTRPQTAMSDNLPARNLLKLRNSNLVVSTGSKRVAINTRLIETALCSNPIKTQNLTNRPRTAPVISRWSSSTLSRRFNSTKSLTRIEKHELLQVKEAYREIQRAEIYAINKVLREAFEAKFAAHMERGWKSE